MIRRRRGRRPRSFVIAFFFLFPSLAGLAGCGRSEVEVRAEFDAYAAGANSCNDASECTVASGGCPVGCFAIVRVERKNDVERKARELVSEYEGWWGPSCAYDCRAPGTLVCVDHRCGETTP